VFLQSYAVMHISAQKRRARIASYDLDAPKYDLPAKGSDNEDCEKQPFEH